MCIFTHFSYLQEARQFTNVANDVPLDIPTHRYGPGSFDIHGLPNLYLGTVVGLLGGKSTGKTTCLKILAGQLKPNLGRFEVIILLSSDICFVIVE